ncbi:MAG: aminotransferase class V-fold PLP-dependent enzyme [Bacteroidetes bacterium]|nr:aminotransferase class V-fold PLP-dependent enzyme [Bacteroidota bacterium]
MTLDEIFLPIRQQIVGIDARFTSQYGDQPLVYADWTASGRLYAPIEQKMLHAFGPFVGNTHSESSVTGGLMTHAYHHAHEIIKKHVHADGDDVLLFIGSGMTAAINKFQRILGVKVPERYRERIEIPEHERPVVFVTHMEHHSNQTTWYETIADVVVLEPDADGLTDVGSLREALLKYADRTMKIGSFSACSNVTGIATPYHALAAVMHEAGGIAIVDFAASAPYVEIDMHPADANQRLDAVIFSPHKFLGGPGTPGVLLFNRSLYTLKSPDQPGGGTVLWTNPWGEHMFSPDIEVREDGGTPAFLQAIRASLAVQLKEQMGTDRIAAREHALGTMMFGLMEQVPHLHLLAEHVRERLCMFSFYFDHIHYNLAVKLLNDRFGIQARGGCSCAGTYGHFLLHVDKQHSKSITDKINAGDLSDKPGWVRISLHPTTTEEEVRYIGDALQQISRNIDAWKDDYAYDPHTNEYHHRQEHGLLAAMTASWFKVT